MKHIWKPVNNIIINVIACVMIGGLLAIDTKNIFFCIGGIVAGILIIQLDNLIVKRYISDEKKRHIVFFILSSVMFLALLVFHALTIKRSQYFLFIVSLASLSPLYNFCGITRFVTITEKTSILKYILGIMLVPFTAFLFYNFYTGTNSKTLYMIVIIAAYYFVLFSLIMIAGLVMKERNIKEKLKTPVADAIITFFVSIVMPITGLVLNRFMYSDQSAYARNQGYFVSYDNSGMFGDFSNPFFYTLVVINGLLLLIPLAKCGKLRLPLFFGRAVCYSFVVYMFIVFLPILPLGIMTLFFIVGIYAFVPLLLARKQWKILSADYKLLQGTHHKKLIAAVFLLGFMTIPSIVTGFMLYDKNNLHSALSYMDTYDVTPNEKVDIAALERTLNARYSRSNRTRLYETGIRTYYSYANIPLVSGIYKWVVFDGKNLDWSYQRQLGALYLDDFYYNYHYGQETDLATLDYYTQNKEDVYISDATHTTLYDESIQAYRTWVDLTLQNINTVKNEYTASFYIPDGVYVSDYYLYVYGEKKMGLLADSRAATAIYKSIVQRALDPGILYYTDQNMLELRVFPFNWREERKTGFELIHQNSFELNLDSHNTIAVEVDTQFDKLETPNAVLLSAEEVNKLPAANKALDYYFIVDCSKSSEPERLFERIDGYCKNYGITDGTLYLTTYRVQKYPLSKLHSITAKPEGGFNLNMAIRDIIKNADGEKTPVILFVTDKKEEQILLPGKLINYASPESPYYYRLSSQTRLTPYSLFANTKKQVVFEPIINPVASYQGHSVVNDGTDQLIILNETIPETSDNQYLNAIALSAENSINAKNSVRNSVRYIQKSFASHILTPSTAFIVVETKEQEEALLKKQEEILAQQEANETAKNLSEPHVLITVLFICLFVIANKRKDKFVPKFR